MTAWCRWCRQPIRWARTPSGARIPLSLDGDPDGRVLLDGGVAQVLSAVAADAERAAGRTLFLAHNAVCPDQPGATRHGHGLSPELERRLEEALARHRRPG